MSRGNKRTATSSRPRPAACDALSLALCTAMERKCFVKWTAKCDSPALPGKPSHRSDSGARPHQAGHPQHHGGIFAQLGLMEHAFENGSIRHLRQVHRSSDIKLAVSGAAENGLLSTKCERKHEAAATGTGGSVSGTAFLQQQDQAATVTTPDRHGPADLAGAACRRMLLSASWQRCTPAQWQHKHVTCGTGGMKRAPGACRVSTCKLG